MFLFHMLPTTILPVEVNRILTGILRCSSDIHLPEVIWGPMPDNNKELVFKESILALGRLLFLFSLYNAVHYN